MSGAESVLVTADLHSKSGRKNCFGIARQMAREGRDVISVCCMKNDAGNVVFDANGIKIIWRKYMEKLLNVENDWDGEVDYPEVMGPHCLISEEEVAAAIKGLKIGKAAGPAGVVSEMMKVAGGFGSRWMTDLINNIVKEGCIPDDGRILVPVYKGKCDPLVCGSYRAINLLEQPMKAPNDTAYKRWSCYSELKLLCKLCRTSPPPAMGARFTVFWACRPCGPAGWLVLLLTKAGDVEINPGPTTLNKKIWICDICHKQIHVRKPISIRCNRIEHWVHLRCAGIRQAQYTDTWTCHLHR